MIEQGCAEATVARHLHLAFGHVLHSAVPPLAALLVDLRVQEGSWGEVATGPRHEVLYRS
jgi:hypothetical protein